MWSISILGGETQKLADVEDMFGRGSVSPDGSNIAYQRLRRAIGAREIWVMGSHGESPHRILTAENQTIFKGIAWSPTGNRLAFTTYMRDKGDHTEIMVQSCNLGGADKTTILQDNHLSAFTCLVGTIHLFIAKYEVGA
jgi:Tol biopolymer transport system component